MGGQNQPDRVAVRMNEMMFRKQLVIMKKKACSQWEHSMWSAPSLVDLARLLRCFSIFHPGEIPVPYVSYGLSPRLPRSRKAVHWKKCCFITLLGR